MPRLVLRAFSLGFFSFALMACSQGPVPVDLKGQNTYGHGSGDATIAYHDYGSVHSTGNTYVPPPETPPSMEANAAVQSIGVSDLSAPAAAPSSPQSAIKPASPVASEQVNPWTNKPHFDQPPPNNGVSETQPLGNPPAADAKPVAQLDNIISKDSPPAANATAQAAPMQTASVEPAAPVAAPKTASSGAFIWPVADKKVLSGFGPKGGGKSNDGINIASSEGEPVWAAADGEVVYVGNELKSYGTMVLIKHAGNKSTSYAHLSRAAVDKYDRVKQGQIIGYVGATGDVKEPQLHFAIRSGKEPVDPQQYLDKGNAG